MHISKRALGRAPQPEVRLAALHALASVAGAERAGESKCRDDAMLSDEAEDALRQAVYQAAAYASGEARMQRSGPWGLARARICARSRCFVVVGKGGPVLREGVLACAYLCSWHAALV